MKLAHELAIGDPTLPRYRRAPSRIDNGSHPHQFSSPQNYYRHLYFLTCDLLLRELQDHFNHKENLAPVLAMESLIIKAVNREEYDSVVQSLEHSCYVDDLDFSIFPFLILLKNRTKQYVKLPLFVQYVMQ